MNHTVHIRQHTTAGFAYHVLLPSCVFALLALLACGYEPYGGDMPIHLSYIYKHLNPDLFPDDGFVSSLSRYPSLFWRCFAWCATQHTVFFVLFIYHVFSLILFFVAVNLLSQRLYDARYIGYIASSLIIIMNVIPWGGASIIPSQADHGLFARAALLLALVFFLQHRYWIASLLWGISLWVHPMMAFFMAIVLLFIWFILPPSEKKNSLRTAPVLLLFSISFLAFLHGIQALDTIRISSRESYDFIVELYRLRLWWHLFPSLWSAKIFVFYAAATSIFIIALKRNPPRYYNESIMIFMAVLAMCLVGLIGSEIVPRITILKLHVFRSMKVWAVLMYILAAALIVHLMSPLKGYKAVVIYGLISLCLIGIIVKRVSSNPGTPDDWEQSCEWIRENISMDAVVLTPPHKSGFRIRARRSPYVEWKDGSALLWDISWAADAWWNRISSISPELSRVSPREILSVLKHDYDHLSAQQIQATNCDYCIMPIEYDEIPEISKHGAWRIYKIK